MALVVTLAAAAVFAIAIVDQRLSEKAGADVAHLLDIEVARLNDTLIQAELDALARAQQTTLIEMVDRTNRSRRADDLRIETVRAHERPFVIQPERVGKIIPGLASWSVLNGSNAVGDFRDVTIVGRDGVIYDSTRDRQWAPFAAETVQIAMSQRRPKFGPAFQSEHGDPRLGIAAPIITPAGEVVGGAFFEARLGAIVGLTSRYEVFGRSSEANLVQRRVDGSAVAITLRRFDRDAAFSVVVPADSHEPAALSLDAGVTRVLRAEDYRGVETVAAIQRINRTDWGLVVKIDAAEALFTVSELTRYIIIGAILAGLGLIVGWLVLVRPLASRVIRTAAAAERIADGDYETQIEDDRRDEIGLLSRSIDRLATDLDVEFTKRSRAEAALRVQHDQLEHEATHDALTHIYNRRAILDCVRVELDEATGTAAPGLVYVDLDGFKEINDERGHSVGDDVITEQTRRLNEFAAEHRGSVGRLGGDEFLVVYPDIGDLDALQEIGDLTVGALVDPVISKELRLHAPASAGATLARPGMDSEELLSEADAALFEAKRAGRGHCVVATEEFRHALACSADFGAQLRHAVPSGEILPWYQPIWKDGGTTLAGFEALVRWVRHDGEVVRPSDFLPVAERLQLLPEIDRVIFKAVCKQIVDWQDLGHDPLPIHVNASTETLSQDDFVGATLETLAATGCPPSAVIIEVTESGVMDDVEATATKLGQIRKAGIAVATDDFGKGYSSLSYLRTLPVDMVKIDREFIAGIDQDEQNQGVVDAVYALAVNFGLTVVVEGIETVKELDYLSGIGDVELQGYLLGRPAPAKEALALLGRGRHDLGNRAAPSPSPSPSRGS